MRPDQIIIRIWHPSQESAFGHVSLETFHGVSHKTDQTSSGIYASFYPKTPQNGLLSLLKKSSRQLIENPDSDDDYYDTPATQYILTLDIPRVEKINAAYIAFKENGCKWSLIQWATGHNNCSGLVYDLLKAGEVEFSSDIDLFPRMERALLFASPFILLLVYLHFCKGSFLHAEFRAIEQKSSLLAAEQENLTQLVTGWPSAKFHEGIPNTCNSLLGEKSVQANPVVEGKVRSILSAAETFSKLVVQQTEGARQIAHHFSTVASIAQNALTFASRSLLIGIGITGYYGYNFGSSGYRAIRPSDIENMAISAQAKEAADQNPPAVPSSFRWKRVTTPALIALIGGGIFAYCKYNQDSSTSNNNASSPSVRM